MTISEQMQKIHANARVQKTLQQIKAEDQLTREQQIMLTEIPAPPFKEEKRAEAFKKLLEDYDLEDVHMDEEGNVFGKRSGTGNGPVLVVSAHLDTVFPEGTDTTVKEKDGKLFAPGIGDDTRGLAEVLAVVRALQASELQTIGDIIIGGTVGEEGAGDLRGVKAYFNENKADGYISIDGSSLETMTYLGTGSFRYRVTFQGKGGHSFGDFGTPSATHALGRAIAAIADLETKADPKTTFSVGPIAGGSSVNAISEQASMEVDLRSNAMEELIVLDKKFNNIVAEACRKENERWGKDSMTVTVEKFGNRPPAAQSDKAPIVQALAEAIKCVGKKPIYGQPSSTDANYPMSLGIPSITSGLGGKAGGAHTLNEWFDPADAYLAVQKHFLLILSLVGIEKLTTPILIKEE
ncbi:M20/M25/M40 family metallo-hydrolase [Oceanobacillus sp. CFH 90083]|uniref:M20/M25/M40 family metallo-hydrolase n=1 Tax=Oceanobacillus sp. CFH 90083 TaxID=2592336 RepID=UPI00188483B3|nr:M20/M25/M40 family metallo-hydrolase [Oceanobacillus sp. CFH 90083]